MAPAGFRPEAGAYQRQLAESARRYVFWFRCVALGTCCALGALSGGPAARGVAAVTVGLTALQAVVVRRSAPLRAAPYIDLSLAAVLAAGQLWLGPAGTGDWLFATVAILSVTCHYEWSSRPGTGRAVALVGIGMYAVFQLPAGGELPLFAVLRLLLQTLLSYVGLVLLGAAARRADDEADRAAESRLEAAAGELRRQAERSFLAVLHDTASATLLAIATAGARQLEWVRDQCAADLRTLAGGHETARAGTDLTELTTLLSRAGGHRDLEVRLVLPEPVLVAGTAADAICLGVTEALTNVARHSGDRYPTLTATATGGRVRVAVQDSGVGFVPSGVRATSRGIRESVVRRADLAGVGVTVTSNPGRGTRVEWTCPCGPRSGTPELPGDVPRDSAADLVRPVRVAALAVCLIVQFGLTGPRFIRDVSRGLATPASITVFGCMAVVAAAALVLARRGGPVPAWAAGVGGSALLACSVAMSVDLPGDVMSRGEHWSFGLVGWYSLVVLFDTAMVLRLLFLAVHAMIFAVPVFAGQGGAQAAETMWVFIVSVTGVQACVVLATGVVRSLAGRAREHTRETADLRLARYSAEVALREHRRRYAGIRATTVPLLEELAAGRLDPASPPARERCAVEATRLRRLMCAADVPDDPLHDDLNSMVEDLERRGIRIELSVKGPPLPVPPSIRGVLLDPVVAAIAAARSSARLTVLHGGGAVRVSAFCTGVPAGWEPPPTDPRVDVNSTTNRDTLWLETVWTATT